MIETGGLWMTVGIALILSCVTLALAIYQARKGTLPSQAETIRDMEQKLAERTKGS